MITEAQARFALRRKGYRLSQRNSGYTILDSDLKIASGVGSDGTPRELTLQEVAGLDGLRTEWRPAGGRTESR
jgi:hypothetical protein